MLLTHWIDKWHSATYNIFAHLLLTYSSTPIEKSTEPLVNGQVRWTEETQGDPRAMPNYSHHWPTQQHRRCHSSVVCWQCLCCWEPNFHLKMVRLHQIRRSCLWLPCKWLQDVARCKGAVPVQSQRALQWQVFRSHYNVGLPSYPSQLWRVHKGICDKKVQEWSEQLLELANIATTQPHATFTVFGHLYVYNPALSLSLSLSLSVSLSISLSSPCLQWKTNTNFQSSSSTDMLQRSTVFFTEARPRYTETMDWKRE